MACAGLKGFQRLKRLSKWRTFRPPWLTSPGPGPKPLDGSISLKLLFKTKLQSESFDNLDDLLGFWVQKLRPKAEVLNWGCSHLLGVQDGISWGANFSDNTKINKSNVAKMFFPSGRGAGFKMN